MQTDFIARLERIRNQKASDLALFLNPQLVRMPLPMKHHDDPFLPFGKEVIRATRNLVVAYVFDIASYLSIGAAGAIALERTIKFALEDNVIILHGPFSGADFSSLTDEMSFHADAITLADAQYISAYLRRADRSAFVVKTDAVQPFDAPESGGFFFVDSGVITTLGNNAEIIRLRLIGEDVVYASSGDDYAERARDILERLRDVQSD